MASAAGHVNSAVSLKQSQGYPSCLQHLEGLNLDH